MNAERRLLMRASNSIRVTALVGLLQSSQPPHVIVIRFDTQKLDQSIQVIKAPLNRSARDAPAMDGLRRSASTLTDTAM